MYVNPQSLLDMDEQEITKGGVTQDMAGDGLRYATPQYLLDMNYQEMERRFKQALDHFNETGRLRPSDLQLPIMEGPPPTCKQDLEGYEGGVFDPEKLGVACIVVPPSEGRGANEKGSTWNLNPVSPVPPPPAPCLTACQAGPSAPPTPCVTARPPFSFSN